MNRLALACEAASQDVGYALRSMRRQPAFAGVIILTLSLGIAANAVVFGIVDRLLLRPPAHVRDPEGVTRLYLREKAPAFLTSVDSTTQTVTSYPLIAALRENVPSLAQVAGVFDGQLSYNRGASAEEVSVSMVSGNFFEMLGVPPALGRLFGPEEDRPPDGVAVAVLSYGFWKSHFGGSRVAVGTEILVGGKPLTVVGVAPLGFAGVDLKKVDVWVPLSALAGSVINKDWRSSPSSFWVRAIGRIKAGATRERVEAEATVAYRNALRTWDQSWRDSGGRVIAGPVVAARGPNAATPGVRVSLWLVGVSAIVLIVACCNVTYLLLARAASRQREIAVRLALGISRGRLVTQLMTESLVLAVFAAVAAMLLTHWGGQFVRSILASEVAWDGSPIDTRVLLFTIAVVALAAMASGLAPALAARRTDVSTALKSGVRDGGRRRSSFADGLIMMQAALSVVLLIGAGLFVQSLRNVRSLDVGADLDRVLLVQADLQEAGFTTNQAEEVYRRAQERIRLLPGVENAAIVSGSVPMRMGKAASLSVSGRPDLPNLPNLPGGGPYFSVVSGDYFATLGSRLKRGRGFLEADERSSARIVVINELLANTYWPGANPIGQCVTIGDDKACSEVVGVVQDVLMFRVVGDPRAQFYIPVSHPFAEDEPPAALLVRAHSDASAIAGAVRREVQSLAPGMPFVAARPLEELIAPELQPWRLGATMFSVFGMLALIIAAVGLYSAIAHAVVQRTHEIGVRLAVGAQRTDIVRMILLDGTRIAGIGLLAGALASVVVAHWVKPLLYEISARDPQVFALVSITMGITAVAASGIPAWRASRVHPVHALNTE